MKIHAITHAPFESVGVIKDWALRNKNTLTETKSYAGEILPKTDAFDCLLVMGGPQSIHEADKWPYLLEEIDLIKQSIDENKFILGFCLGAQLIGEALGARATQSPEKEIGVFPVALTEEGANDPVFKHFPQTFDVLHWHNDMAGIPEGARLLASSPGCPHQAFRFQNRIYGLQFHMEINKEGAKALIENCPEDLKPGKYIQSKDSLLASDFASINENMFKFLDIFFENILEFNLP